MSLLDFFSKQTPINLPTPRNFEEGSIESILLRGIELPTPKEQKDTDWVLFGNNNSFPKDLLEYKNSSAIHDAIIEGKTSLIAGNGLLFDDTRDLSDSFIVNNWRLVPFWRKLDRVFWMVTRDQQT
jgi:hypothetical protein